MIRINSALTTVIVVTVATCLADAAVVSAQQAPPVQVAEPLARRVVDWDLYTGRFEPSEQVEIRARVSGFVDQVHFRDGALVRKGDPLFTIDQRPYRLAVDVAQAEAGRAKAQVELARNEVERAEGLTQNRTITARDVDQRRTNLDSALATQQAAEANLKTAALNLEWTEVRAPLTGRVSNRRVDPGNLIAGGQSGATLLTTIVAADPIYFTFDASEADFLRFARRVNASANPGVQAGPMAEVRLADESEWKRRGEIDFVDNALDARSGTIRQRVVFENKDQFLTPGTFGRLRVHAGETEALLVPDVVVLSDQASKIVLTVGPENKIVPKPVTLGSLSDGLRVVTRGLSRDDKVVIGGFANPMVRPGSVVTPMPGEIKSPTS